MKRIGFLLTVFVLSAISTIQAASVSPDQAKQIAAQFISAKQQQYREQGKPVRRATPVAQEMEAKVLFEARHNDSNPYLYAVRYPQQEGFVLISGDDRFAPVLGYSETGSIEVSSMPENLRAWLQGYVDEMHFLDSIGYQYTPSQHAPAATKAPIQPLLETLWNQGTPFNDLCPEDNDGYLSVTGCVATAMAQVVNYHMQHQGKPTKIIATIDGYTTNSHELTVGSVPAGTMLPSPSLLINDYYNDPTDSQKEAVAKLMLYCGTSVGMDYTSSASSAHTSRVADALISYFGFDNTTKFVHRANYTYAMWIDLIYDELVAARPVEYDGHSSGGGHAFVIDGYDRDDLFHVNWGWGGSSDGYFALSVLNPDDDGQIGASGSSDGYSGSQGAMIHCQILGESADPEPACLSMTLLGVNDCDITFSAFNNTGTTRSFDYGIAFVNNDGSYTLIGDYWSVTDLKDNWGWNSITRSVPKKLSYKNTSRKIVPISREKGQTAWCSTINDSFNYVLAEYDAYGNPTLSIHPNSKLSGSELDVPTSKFVNEDQQVTVTLTNSGEEFYGSVYLFVSKTEVKGDYEAWRGLTVLANSSLPISFDWTPEETGTYYLWVALDWGGNEVLDSTTITITNDPGLEGKILAISSVSFVGLDNKSWVIDPVTGVRAVDIYMDNDTLSGAVWITNMTDESISQFKLRVEFDRYIESTGQYEDEKSNLYWNTSFNPGVTRGYSINRVLELDNTYRIRISKRESSSATPVNYDDHYIIHLHRAKSPEPTDINLVPEDQLTNNQLPITNKILLNGQILILRGDKVYTITGQEVR